jgi:CelD/BcsL family acetyltransferase involved in cellulose biosynthesis
MLYEIDPLQDPRWTELVREHPKSSIFHSREWLEALQVAYDYRPVAFTTSASAEPLANGIPFCGVASRLTGSRLVSLPFSDHCQPLATAAEMNSLIPMLQNLVSGREYRYLELRPLLFDEADAQHEVKLCKSASYQFHSLDLRPASEEIFRGFHKSCIQRKIRRSKREGLDYVQGRSQALVNDFYALFVMTRRRQGALPQPIRWFQSLANCLGDNFRIRIAYKDNQPVAGIVTLHFRASLVYKYGCSDARFHNLGAMPFLFWKTIEDGKRMGAEELDLGRTDVDNAGLGLFKQRLGAAPSHLNYYRYPATARSNPVWTSAAVRSVVRRLPDSVCSLAGDLLYRHVG